MKYILTLVDPINPDNNTTLECSTAQEARDYKVKAKKKGFIVTVKGEKHDKRENQRILHQEK